jgi:Rad3-related DNA helicase
VETGALRQLPLDAVTWPDALGLLAPMLADLGPLAVAAVAADGPPESRRARVEALALVLIDGTARAPIVLHARPKDATRADAGGEIVLLRRVAEVLAGRCVVTHDDAFASHIIERAAGVGVAGLRDLALLDTRELLALTHPDRQALHLTSFAHPVQEVVAAAPAPDRIAPMLAEPASLEDPALRAALATLRMLLQIAAGAESDESRYRHARRAIDRHLPDSAWLALLGKGLFADRVEDDERRQFIEITPGDEARVPFDESAIVAALEDEARGRRHFPRYRVRPEQIELTRSFVRNLRDGGRLLLEGGTGVGKSLAYLAAAIPFAVERAEQGQRDPIVISTRTKLLQDQLVENDIAAAARLLGYGDLRALSIKGRANYICEKRLGETLGAGREPGLLREDRLAWAVLLSCARIRPGGEVAGLAPELLRRYRLLPELVRSAVARRPEQCTREECGKRRSCPFGQRRRALAHAHVVVANHDLLLRWPPDYPRVEHVICDEGHELAGVADDVYALSVRPDDLVDRIDEIFGAPPARPRGRDVGTGLLPRKQRLEAQPRMRPLRRDLALEFAAIGRGVAEHATEYGEVQLPMRADRVMPRIAEVADGAASRLEQIARYAEELDARAEWTFDEAPAAPTEGPSAVQKSADAMRQAAVGLRQAFSDESGDVVAAFDRLVAPYDRWQLMIRSVSPADDFHQRFLESLSSFAVVSASLFIAGDAFAALGELEIEERASFGVDRISVPSPFDYARHMRVLARHGFDPQTGLVEEMTRVIVDAARHLGGRTLGLFTSLRRMTQVAERLRVELEGEGIEVLAPLRAGDDPAGLVRRFQMLNGRAVLLGARTFWQGLDIAGDSLQAVVIEKLPFEVPTELRRRREERIRELGLNAFERYRLGKMLLHLKQMTGRLIRSEDDRGIVVIVDARSDRSYFASLERAFPQGTRIQLIDAGELPEVVAELGLGDRQATRS